MSYSYQSPNPYGGTYNDSVQTRKPSAIPGAVLGSVIGGTTGAIIGNKKGSIINKNGEFNDAFVKNIYEEHINGSKNLKEIYNGRQNIINNIDKVKNQEELKTLFEKNKATADSFCKEINQTSEEYLSRISEKNIDSNKKIIKDKFITDNKVQYQDMKNQIQACWNKDKKSFVKAESVSDDVFNTIKKSKNKIKYKSTGKFGIIGAVVGAVCGYLGLSLLIK